MTKFFSKFALIITFSFYSSFTLAAIPKFSEPEIEMSKVPPTDLQKAIEKLPKATFHTKKVVKPKKKPGVELGMTKQQVIRDTDWGKPESKKKIINSDGEWDFFYYNCGTAVLTFLDNELYEIETEGD